MTIDNGNAYDGASLKYPRRVEMEAFDALPKSLRRAVNEAIPKLSAADVLRLTAQHRVKNLVRAVREQEDMPYEELMRRQEEAAQSKRSY